MKTTTQSVYTVKPSQVLDNALLTFSYGNYAEALHLFNMVLLLDADNKMAETKRAMCYMYLNKHKTAKAILCNLLNMKNPDADVYFALAELYKLNLNYEVAATYCIKALAIDEQNANYLFLAAELCYLQHDFDEAYVFINKAIVQSPFRKEFYYWRALIFVKFKKPEVAINDINKALALAEFYADAYRLRAHCKMLLGNIDGYLADLRLAQHVDQMAHNSRIAA